jgi:excisionase family DNA binding protein
MDDKIFSISQAAEYLGVFPLTLRNWEKRGLVKSFRTLGGHRRFKKSNLDKIIDISGTGNKLKESIRKLEEIDFKNNHQQAIEKIITDLRDISENI